MGIENGALLKVAAGSFDVLLTVDSNLPHQQNPAALGLGIVVVRAAGTRLRDLRAVLPAIKRALRAVKSGQIHIIEANE